MLDWIQERPIPSIDRTNKRGTLTGIQSSLSGIKRRITRKSLPNLSSQTQGSPSASSKSFQQKENKSLHDNKQSTLHNHFTTSHSNVDLSEEKGDEEMSFASHLNANKGPQHSTLFDSLQPQLSSHSSGKTIGKRRKTDTGNVTSSRIIEEDKEPTKRRKTSQSSFENVSSSDGEDGARRLYDQPKDGNREIASVAASDETQLLAWSSDEEQSIKPKEPSPALKRKIKPKKRTKSAFAPAISPSKRKTLIEQSAKDYAMQQARRNQRSALSPIENQCDSRRLGFLDPSVNQSIVHFRDKTPSPLRKGFSMVQLGDGDYFSRDVADSDEEDDLDMLGNPKSPLLSRMLPFQNSHESRRTQSSPAKTKQRIYAYETQAASQSKSGLGILTEEDNMEQDQSIINEEAVASNAAGSSQTAPGGSWPDQTKSVDRQSKQEEEHMVSRKRTSNKAKDLQNTLTGDTLRSASKNRGRTEVKKSDALNTTSAFSDVETQPLPWEEEFAEDECLAQAESASLKTSKRKASHKHNTPRYSAGWNDLSQVWSGHIDSDKSAAKKRKGQHQSSLNSFGFSRMARESQKSIGQQNAMSDPENVDSDDELDCLSATFENENKSQVLPRSNNKLKLNDEGSATSSPPKNASRERFSSRQTTRVNLNSSQDALSIPSDSGLDSQIRHFLNGL